jgi:hypothetical protein
VHISRREYAAQFGSSAAEGSGFSRATCRGIESANKQETGVNIQDLRRHLFETLEALRDETKPMDVQRAKAVSEVAQTIINSAKVEVDYARFTEQRSGTGFIPDERPMRLVGNTRG